MTTENLITAPQGTDMRKAERILRQYKIEKLPVVNKDGLLIGLITYRDILQIRNYPNAVKDGMGRLLVGAGAAVLPKTCSTGRQPLQKGVDVVTLDSAHGHTKV